MDEDADHEAGEQDVSRRFGHSDRVCNCERDGERDADDDGFEDELHDDENTVSGQNVLSADSR